MVFWEISMLIVRVGGAGLALALALSCVNAFGQTSQIAAVSGRDQLALHDLATGAELARFDAPGGSSDLVALGSGMALSNHTAGNEVIGAIIGLVYALVQVATGHASQQDAFFLGGYILGGVGFFGLVGFISGVFAYLIHARSKAGSAPSPERAVSAAEPVSAPSHGNFIVHHWRGELPLWVSYWVINFLGNLCAV